MAKRFLLFTMLFCLLACRDQELSEREKAEALSEIPLDKSKWQARDEFGYIYRDKMLNDVVYKPTFKGLTKTQIIDSLGQPTRSDKDFLFYEISRDKLGFVTLRAKTLVLKFGADGKTEKIMIHG